MNIEGWRYHNHAAFPNNAPHELPNLKPIEDKSIWSIGNGKAFIARWTSDFDCDEETSWWYLIRKRPYSIDTLGKKTRKKIIKALEQCYVIKIDSKAYAEDLWRVYQEAAKRYQNFTDEDEEKQFIKRCMNPPDNSDFWAGFEKNTGRMIGWKECVRKSNMVIFAVGKYATDYLNLGISYALNHETLNYYLSEKDYIYVTDGERSVYHVTNVQNFFIEHFGFTKAYCKLHITYRFPLNILVKLAFPFRKLLVGNTVKLRQIKSIMLMEEIARQSR